VLRVKWNGKSVNRQGFLNFLALLATWRFNIFLRTLPMLTIRPASADDDNTIRRLIRAEGLDPTSLKWQNFKIAEWDGELAGIGQVKQYPGCRELGSLVTLKQYRKHGVASKLIEALETNQPRPLYLVCAGKMESFYRRFGYHTISWFEYPAVLKLKLSFMLPARLFGIRVLVMRKD
jgi:amino-acid N-acetyltransferase